MKILKDLLIWKPLRVQDEVAQSGTSVTKGTAQNPDIFFQAREASEQIL